MYEYDIVLVSDFRLPGGTNHSNAEELKVLRAASIRTGLFNVNSRLSAKPRPWSRVILEQLKPGYVDPIVSGTTVKAKLVIIRHPIAAGSLPDLSGQIIADKVVIVANQAAIQGDGTVDYDPGAIDRIVRASLSLTPVWAPIGPEVRKSLLQWEDSIVLSEDNWLNIFASSANFVERTGFNRERPIIGRHSRPQATKWPDNAKDIRRAWPTTEDYDVRILGGAKPAIELLGGRPSRWTIHKFGSLEPSEFLRDVDFWVYFHHPSLREAYGRAIMEALWAGCVVVLPEYLRETYGSAAIYGNPSDVRSIVDSFVNGDSDFLAQSKKGQEFAAQHSGSLHEERIKGLLSTISDSETSASSSFPPTNAHPKSIHRSQSLVNRPLGTSLRGGTPKATALFITSNGAGMGHLTRMLGIARRLDDDIQPVFFSMSEGVAVVDTAGIPYEYVPFNSALKTQSSIWHQYFQARLTSAIEAYNAKIVIFDGTWPYRGLLTAIRDKGLLKVWIRRGMWKPGIKQNQLKVSAQFDLVIEPGDFASEYDDGATTRVSDAIKVSPMAVLEQDELLSRTEALKDLGLPDDGTRYALITLGAGNINDIGSLQTAALEAIGSVSGWNAVLTKAPIANQSWGSETATLSTFPLAKYTKAFDFAISAAGYNSFSEWIDGSLPTVWVPNLKTMTDDQDARARWAADFGAGLRFVENEDTSISRAVGIMTDDSVREGMRRKMESLPAASGASQAARIIGHAWLQHRNYREGR